MMDTRLRIYFTGVGGQGSLTATTLLARTALDQGLSVVSGEIHGMAQRGGVVESTVLLGGWQSPTLFSGEADILLGFEPLETLRGLHYLKPDGVVFSSSEFIPPPSVSAGKTALPPLSFIQENVQAVASKAWFLPIRNIGTEAGSPQSGNAAMLGALCASGRLPLTMDALRRTLGAYLPAKLVSINIAAAEKGAARVREGKTT